ncbi:MAG: glucosaminidase domain-containing protein [Flavobacteriaceae bacterium]|nr:glucosaminidase domain-containing protein [Flavobacteriaceae bacterium]
MELKVVFICLLTIGFLTSCKSKKQVVHSQPKTAHHKVIERTEEITQIKSKKEIKSTIFTSTEDYIQFFKNAAMEEMRIYKIPASITLAQGVLESSSGNSELTKRSNNHFGIKCHKEWEGNHTFHDDDEKGECFRVYDNPTTSYRDHSLFLTSRRRYSKLFSLAPGDYVSWANGLSEAGYATDRRYPAKLIGLIEKFELHKYDTQVLGKSFEVVKVTEILNHIVVKGDTLYSISKRYGLTVDELKLLNGLSSNEISIGQSLNLAK